MLIYMILKVVQVRNGRVLLSNLFVEIGNRLLGLHLLGKQLLLCTRISYTSLVRTYGSLHSTFSKCFRPNCDGLRAYFFRLSIGCGPQQMNLGGVREHPSLEPKLYPST